MKILDSIDSGKSQVTQDTSLLLTKLNDIGSVITATVGYAAASRESFDQIERKVHQLLIAIGKDALDLYVSMQGDGNLGPKAESTDGKTLKRSETKSLTKIRSIFGTHYFSQFTYAPQVNKRTELLPVSARMSLPQNQWSFLLQEFSQVLAVDSAFSLVAENLGKFFGGKFSSDTVERINQNMGQHAAEYVHSLPQPAPDTEATLLVASADCKGVPMVKEDAKKVAAFEQAKTHPGNRRMATVTSVYSVEPHFRTAEEITSALFREELPQEPSEAKRPRPQNKITTAHMPCMEDNGDGGDIEISAINMGIGWILEQIEARQQPKQKLVVIQDGQECLWETLATQVEFGEEAIPILDILHVLCYLWSAAGLFKQDEKGRKAMARKLCMSVLQGKVENVIRGLRSRGKRCNLRGENQKKLNRICGYLQKNRHRMRYDEYLAAGYPIASGVIEGACRHLVKDRMERSGMRWRLPGATSMLHVRAMHQSDHWRSFLDDRIKTQVATIHKNRHLLKDYRPTTLAC